jgi:hypothetical protein
LRGLYIVSGVKFTTANDVARQVLTVIGLSGSAGNGDEALPLSAATALLSDADLPWSAGDLSLRTVLQQVVTKEAVQCLDDLVLRRANWGVAAVDLDRVRDRVSRLVPQVPIVRPGGGYA